MAEINQNTKIWIDDIIKYEYNHHKIEYDLLHSKISNCLTENFYAAPFANAVAFNCKDIVGKVLPDIVDQQNEDCLIPLSILEPILPGIYRYDDFLIFAHRYFRKNYSVLNSFNNNFLGRFDRLVTEGSNESIWLAIDWDLIGLAGTEQEYCERAYWYGPPFNFDILQISCGVSKYVNEKYDEFIPGIKSTEFYWYENDKNKKFQCEEINLSPTEYGESKRYNCRYVHSLMKKGSDYFMHFDGAIRSYSENEIIDRKTIAIDSAGRDIQYIKLWRIDGMISVSLWEELLAAFYRGNELVIQYLNREDEYKSFN